MKNWIKAIVTIIGMLLGAIGLVILVVLFPIPFAYGVVVWGVYWLVRFVKEEFDTQDEIWCRKRVAEAEKVATKYKERIYPTISDHVHTGVQTDD